MSSPSAKRPSALSRWYARAAAFNVEDLFNKKREPGPPRTIFVNQGLPQAYYSNKRKVKKDAVYASNQVITSKYTVITFIPRNLLEQFRRVANMFFLGVGIIQFFPKFSNISGAVAILPLLIILAITAAKDGYEDLKRHQSDKEVNYSKVRVLAGGNWSNHNATASKHKTFIRGIIPKREPKVKEMTPRESAVAYDYEFDAEAHDPPHWKETLWEDVRVGDMVKILDNEPIPADILICATSEEEDVAFVETKNLDGETNLKSRNAVPSLTDLNNAKECADPKNNFAINCDRPDTDMYRLNANVKHGDHTSPVDLSMTLLRGTVLRNTKWVIGVVLFTGLDTKIVMNSGGTPSKRSRVERQMNPQVFFNLLLMAGMAVVCAIADSLLEVHYFPLGAPWLFGDDRSDDNPRINGLVTWAFSILTFQSLVPISLYISIEFVKTCQAAWIYFDSDICYEKTGQATVARSWNLSDDLGQIEYIFSDKTGTLTQNLMLFRQCSIGSVVYKGNDNREESLEVNEKQALLNSIAGLSENQVSGSSSSAMRRSTDSGTHRFYDRDLEHDLEAALSEDPDRRHARNLNGFFTVLSLCHTVLTAQDPETGRIIYKAQSPDEAALVQAAADVGFQFLGRERDILSLRTPSSEDVEKYELLNILEFTSARKRMSVILRRVDGDDHRLFLLTKGADNVIFERLKPGVDQDIREETEKHLNQFANGGLRTLTLAYKIIAESDYDLWNKRYHEATVAMKDREEQIEAVSNEVEQDLRLLGATAIEDKLQDGVPETIADLKRAGIKIWVATGDKLETAIAIGRSTNLISPDSNIIIVRGGPKPARDQIINATTHFFPDAFASPSTVDPNRSPSPEKDKAKTEGGDIIPLQRIMTGASIVGDDNGDRPGGFVLVVDGAALLEAFADEENKALLLRLATLCEGVICCRVSPLQKALIVHLVKDGLGSMTLAIGDGANDVSMIQAADVGVGISGEEGLQAVNSSDYAIAQFRFLKKLLLVHGHWSYARNGLMILNFFYKNVVPTGVLWWFQIYCGWSGAFVFEYVYILFWNSIWTIAPVIGIGLFDRFLNSDQLMQVPELYHYGRKHSWFGMRLFFIYMFDGLVQSVVIFFLIFYSYTTISSRADGFNVDQTEFSTTMAISAVMVADVYTGFSATAWSGWIFFAVYVGIVIVWVFTAIYSSISPQNGITTVYGNVYLLFHSPYFWLCLPLTFLLAMAPKYILRGWQFISRPSDIDIIRWIGQKEPNRDLSQLAPSGGVGSTLKGMLEAQARLQSTPSLVSRSASRRSSVISIEPRLNKSYPEIRSASRMDMATGTTSVDRGFDFATEEGGVAIQRIQTNLSERRENMRARKSSIMKGKEALSHVLSLSRIKKKPPSPKKGE